MRFELIQNKAISMMPKITRVFFPCVADRCHLQY